MNAGSEPVADFKGWRGAARAAWSGCQQPIEARVAAVGRTRPGQSTARKRARGALRSQRSSCPHVHEYQQGLPKWTQGQLLRVRKVARRPQAVNGVAAVQRRLMAKPPPPSGRFAWRWVPTAANTGRQRVLSVIVAVW